MNARPGDADLREKFERLVGRDSFGLSRSRKGTYTNPAIARDWKWFQLGAKATGPTLRPIRDTGETPAQIIEELTE